jgi:hypothetical protein
VLAEGECDHDELAPLPESGQRNGALPCELLYNGGPTRTSILSSVGLTPERHRLYRAIMLFDSLHRWRLANSTESVEIAKARVVQRRGTKRDNRARNQLAYAKRLKSGKVKAARASNAAEERARFADKVRAKALTCQAEVTSILAGIAQLFAMSKNLPVPESIAAVAAASAGPPLAVPRGIAFVDVGEEDDDDELSSGAENADDNDDENEGVEDEIRVQVTILRAFCDVAGLVPHISLVSSAVNSS